MKQNKKNFLIIPKYRRPCVEKHIKLIILKKVFYTLKLSYIRNNYKLFLEKKHTKFNSITRNHNYCSVISRVRSVYIAFRVARHAIHQKGNYELLIGTKKWLYNLMKKMTTEIINSFFTGWKSIFEQNIYCFFIKWVNISKLQKNKKKTKFSVWKHISRKMDIKDKIHLW